MRAAWSVLVGCAVATLAACPSGERRGEPESAAVAAGIEVKSVELGKAFSKGLRVMQPTREFEPMQKICLSVRLWGRPTKGKVGARFMHGDRQLAATEIDLDGPNRGNRHSLGPDTFLAYSYQATSPLPVGDDYRAEITYEGERLGSHPFKIVPVPGAP